MFNFASTLSSNLLLLNDWAQVKVPICLALSWQCTLAPCPPQERCPILAALVGHSVLPILLWHKQVPWRHMHMDTSWACLIGPVPKVLYEKPSRVPVGVSLLPAHLVSSEILGAGHLFPLFWTKGTRPMSPSPPASHLVVNFGHLNQLALNQ